MIKISDISSISKAANIGALKLKYFSGCSIDSRTVKKDELFIAIKGESTDGHKYIKDVFKRNVKAVLVNKVWYDKNKNLYKDKTFFVVKDTVTALGELARIHKYNFSVPVLCVGGSNGKTTTKDLISHVLSKKYSVLKNEGNFNNHIGLPLTLLKLNKNHSIAVLEAGSNHFNEIAYLCRIAEPHFGLVTNIGKEHLEFFKNLAGVAKEEFELYEYLNSNLGECFINLDDEFSKKFRTKNKGTYFSYSLNNKSDVTGKFIKFDKDFKPEIEIRYGLTIFNVKVNAFGKHSILNGLAAAAVGLYFGLTVKDIQKSLSTFKAESSKRMEVTEINGLKVINDAYNSNPDSVKLGLETMKEYKTKGEKFIVLGDMLEMGKTSKDEHYNIGKMVRSFGFRYLFTHGADSYMTFKGAGNIPNNFHFEDKKELSALLKAIVKKGDVIYIKGSRGMKMEEIISELKN